MDNGDEIEQDGIFSGKVNLSESDEGYIYFRAIANIDDSKINIMSEISTIAVISHFDDQDIEIAVNNADNAKSKYEEFITSGQSEDTSLSNTVLWLNSQNNIRIAKESETGSSIWFLNSSGILGGVVVKKKINGEE